MKSTILSSVLRTAITTAVILASTTQLVANAAEAVVGPTDVVLNDEMQIVESVTGAEGDAMAGRATFADRKLGNCLACHTATDQSDQQFHGNVGPSLDGVGSRYPVGMLRAIVVDAKKVFGDQSVMPGFYSLDVGAHVAEEFNGKTILTAEQVEDVVAYLSTLQ